MHLGRRVTRPPGGPSSISFTSADAPPCGPSTGSGSSSAAKPKPQLQDTKPQQTPAPPPQQLQLPMPNGQEPPNINAGKANKAVHTSSKVLNPPGGKTSISFF